MRAHPLRPPVDVLRGELPIRFALPGLEEVEEMAASTGLEVRRPEGDYAGSGCEPAESPFLRTFARASA